jgi:hypothetical protein
VGVGVGGIVGSVVYNTKLDLYPPTKPTMYLSDSTPSSFVTPTPYTSESVPSPNIPSLNPTTNSELTINYYHKTYFVSSNTMSESCDPLTSVKFTPGGNRVKFNATGLYMISPVGSLPNCPLNLNVRN